MTIHSLPFNFYNNIDCAIFYIHKNKVKFPFSLPTPLSAIKANVRHPELKLKD